MKLLPLVGLALLAPLPAHGYELMHSAAGPALRWPSGTIPLTVGAEDLPRLQAATLAASTYRLELERMVSDVALGMPQAAGAAPATMGSITVEWIEDGWDDDWVPGALAVTVTSYDPTTGEVLGAHVAVNDKGFKWIEGGGSMDGCRASFDLEGVLTHEMGHAFGLAHSAASAATMYPSTGPCDPGNRSLAEDDVLGLEALYVELAPAGCNVASHELPLTAALVPLVLLGRILAGRRRRMALVAAVLGILAVSPSPTRATTVWRMSVEDLGQSSVVVARGLITATAASQEGARPYTDSVLAVSECMRGECGALLTVRQLGGAGARVEGNAELVPGREVVLFLRRRRDGAYAVTGMSQGAFAVERDPSSHAVVGIRRDLSGLYLVAADRDAAVAEAPAALTLAELRRVARLP